MQDDADSVTQKIEPTPLGATERELLCVETTPAAMLDLFEARAGH